MRHHWSTLRRAAQLTQAQVASELGVERLTIIRYEQGMFGHLSSEILDRLSDLYNTDQEVLLVEYQLYQHAQRTVFATEHSNWRFILRKYSGRMHPLEYYRNYYDLSRNGLCKGLCLDYGPISDYEKNTQRSIPDIIKRASEQISWDWTYLESAVLEWRADGRSSIKRTRAETH